MSQLKITPIICEKSKQFWFNLTFPVVPRENGQSCISMTDDASIDYGTHNAWEFMDSLKDYVKELERTLRMAETLTFCSFEIESGLERIDGNVTVCKEEE